VSRGKRACADRRGIAREQRFGKRWVYGKSLALTEPLLLLDRRKWRR
jgi:hypothetical protein